MIDHATDHTGPVAVPRMSRWTWGWLGAACLVAVLVVLAFAARRVLIDFPGLGAGLTPSAEDAQYLAHRTLAYAHIIPGVLYLVGGAAQLTPRVRRHHYTVHRRLGRLVVPCGLASGLFAIIFGLMYPFGGPTEVAATLCFGIWFEACLVTAYVAIRRGHVAAHRRWMIRAYAIASAVGTIRLLIGVLAVPFGFATAFGVAFWMAFTLHAAVVELYLRRAGALVP
jgi:uncharacterized membrane protein